MKKFMAILATALVMALSATSVFAAVSAETKVTATTADGKAVEVNGLRFEGNEYDAPVQKAFEVVRATTDLEGVRLYIKETIDVKAPEGYVEGTPITLTLEVDGILEGDNVVVVCQNTKTGEWDGCPAVAIADGKVNVTFTHFCPVMIATYEEYSQGGSWYYDPEIDGPVDPSLPGAATSPKTGVLPVAAIAAGICLAGAAVCGKKVR